MVNVIVELSKYVIILAIAIYTFECFAIFGFEDPHTKNSILRRQNVLMFLMHFVAFMVMFLQTEEKKMLGFYGMQVILFIAILVLYHLIYPKVSRLVVNNMCMLLTIGFIMITRLSYELAVKQFIIATAALIISLFIPVIIRKVKALSEWRKFYAIAGIVMLAIVIVGGRVLVELCLQLKLEDLRFRLRNWLKLYLYFLWQPVSRRIEVLKILLLQP